MIIRASEIDKYMQIHNVDKIPVEVVNTSLPECKELNQSARTLAKRLVITGAQSRSRRGLEAVRISYVMYNSFKKSQCFIPAEWELEVLTGDLGSRILAEFADHGSNLEQKFRDTFAKYNPEIQEKVTEAAELLKQAVEISEQHGLPFYPQASIVDGLAQGYFPKSFDAFFSELMQEDSDIVNELTGVYQYEEQTGWQSSAGTC